MPIQHDPGHMLTKPTVRQPQARFTKEDLWSASSAACGEARLSEPCWVSVVPQLLRVETLQRNPGGQSLAEHPLRLV